MDNIFNGTKHLSLASLDQLIFYDPLLRFGLLSCYFLIKLMFTCLILKVKRQLLDVLSMNNRGSLVSCLI